VAVCACPAQGVEVLDRVVASVGSQAITQSDVEQEYRLEQFLDGKFPEAPPASELQPARERLTSQTVLALELEPEATAASEFQKAATLRLETVRRRFVSPEAYEKALHALGMTEPQVLQQLVLQQRILTMIDQRLRPATSAGPDEIEAYYHSTFVPEYVQRNGGTPPALSEVESQIREILIQKEIDRLLAEWLEELRPNRRVRFHSF